MAKHNTPPRQASPRIFEHPGRHGSQRQSGEEADISPEALLYTRMEQLESDRFINTNEVPLDGRPLSVNTDRDTGFTGFIRSKNENLGLSVRLVGVGFNPDNEPFFIGEAATGSHSRYFISRPPAGEQPFTVAGPGFPASIESPQTSTGHAASWKLELSEEPNGELLIREAEVPNGQYPVTIYTPTSADLMNRPDLAMPAALWAPEPEALAGAVNRTAGSVGATMLLPTVERRP